MWKKKHCARKITITIIINNSNGRRTIVKGEK
jgi:hypothetical protein